MFAIVTFRFYNSRYDIGSVLSDNVYPDGMNTTDKYEYVTEAAARLTKVCIVFFGGGGVGGWGRRQRAVY